MKYRIWEKILCETVGSPDMRLVDEIEASSFKEAYKVAKVRQPHLGAIRIDNYKDDFILEGGHFKSAIEFDADFDIENFKFHASELNCDN